MMCVKVTDGKDLISLAIQTPSLQEFNPEEG